MPASSSRRARAPAIASLPAIAATAPELREDGRELEIAAMDRQTAAIEALTSKLDMFKPAADALHSLSEAQIKFCALLKGKWPWIATAGFLFLQRTINAAPEDVPKLIGSLTAIAKALAGAQP